MAHSFKLQIPSPCSENWDNFTKTSHGGFCNSCSKEVIDFTKLTDVEIKAYFKTQSSTKLCGKFKQSQLNREFKMGTAGSYPAYLKLGAFFLTFTAFLNTRNLQAQQKNPTENLQSINANNYSNDKIKMGEIGPKAKETDFNISGKIIEQGSNLPIPGVAILVKGTNFGTTTDITGQFALHLDLSKIPADPALLISYLGYESVEVKLDKRSMDLGEIKIKADLKGEVVICRKGNIFTRIWWKIKRLL